MLFQFDWQMCDTTHFIRMMSPDASETGAISQNRGFVAIPEIGDQVMVGFEYSHPDFPFAMGGMFHGKTGLGGGIDNRVRSIQTRSGHKLVFTEDESILLTKYKTFRAMQTKTYNWGIFALYSSSYSLARICRKRHHL